MRQQLARGEFADFPAANAALNVLSGCLQGRPAVATVDEQRRAQDGAAEAPPEAEQAISRAVQPVQPAEVDDEDTIVRALASDAASKRKMAETILGNLKPRTGRPASLGAADWLATTAGEAVRVVTFSFLCPLLEKYGTFIARCNALIEKVSSF
eukprot:SAG31_NODE_17008_length_686_cov_2.901193_1_plen_153_part_01